MPFVTSQQVEFHGSGFGSALLLNTEEVNVAPDLPTCEGAAPSTCSLHRQSEVTAAVAAAACACVRASVRGCCARAPVQRGRLVTVMLS